MHIEDMDAAIRAAGMGWLVTQQCLVVTADETPGLCIREQCMTHIETAVQAGATATDYASALWLALFEDPIDTGPRDAIKATGAAMRLALAAMSMAWTTPHGVIVVWDVADRGGTQVTPQWSAADVYTEAYYAQAELAGASINDMAFALAELVGGDSTAFDAIMAA